MILMENVQKHVANLQSFNLSVSIFCRKNHDVRLFSCFILFVSFLRRSDLALALVIRCDVSSWCVDRCCRQCVN